MRKKVYIINDSGHDFSLAEQYGKFVIMTTGDIPKYNCSETFRKFMDIMKDSNELDLILQSGPATVNIIACCIFVAMHKRLNLLLFTGERYIVRELIFTKLTKEVKHD